MNTKCESNFFSYLLVFILVGLFSSAFTNHDPDPLTYVVKPGDTLTKIADRFGNTILWLGIYEANERKIENPNLIYPRQQLNIPPTIFAQVTSPQTKSKVQSADTSTDSVNSEGDTAGKTLKKFRKAFKKVVSTESESGTESKEPKPTYQGLGLGGLVLDETRSKMGSNFYSVFYKRWESPKNVQNFTITVSEQPVPSRGTMVQVKIDNKLVYKNRLEPRYYKTEQAAERAVKICRQRLKQIATMDNELAGY